jgi:hypothetical protein
LDILSPRNNKQWLKYEQFCAKGFKNDRIEDLDAIALIDVYERLIHVANP